MKKTKFFLFPIIFLAAAFFLSLINPRIGQAQTGCIPNCGQPGQPACKYGGVVFYITNHDFAYLSGPVKFSGELTGTVSWRPSFPTCESWYGAGSYRCGFTNIESAPISPPYWGWAYTDGLDCCHNPLNWRITNVGQFKPSDGDAGFTPSNGAMALDNTTWTSQYITFWKYYTPAAPINLQPNNFCQAISTSVQVRLSWTAGARNCVGASGCSDWYQVYIVKPDGAAINSPFLNTNTWSATFDQAGRYWWVVKQWNGYKWSNWSSWASIDAVGIPGKPSDLAPTGCIGNPNPVRLSWVKSPARNCLGGACFGCKDDFWLEITTTGQNTGAWILNQYWDVNLTNTGTYNWRVKQGNGYYGSDAPGGPGWTNATLTLDRSPPPVPSVSSPLSGAQITGNSVLLTLNPVSDIGCSNSVLYNILLYKGSVLIKDSNWQNSNSLLVSSLSPGNYSWIARTRDNFNNTSEWSPYWQFVIKPQTPTDTTLPTARITKPLDNGNWYPKPSFLAEFEYSDSGGSGLSQCLYRVTTKVSDTGWLSAGACSGNGPVKILKIIEVGEGKVCREQGRDTCDVEVRAVDNAGLLSGESGIKYNIDWEPPTTGINP